MSGQAFKVDGLQYQEPAVGERQYRRSAGNVFNQGNLPEEITLLESHRIRGYVDLNFPLHNKVHRVAYIATSHDRLVGGDAAGLEQLSDGGDGISV